MVERLLRPFFRGFSEIDSQIDKFRDLRDSSRLGSPAQAGTWTVGPHGLKRDNMP